MDKLFFGTLVLGCSILVSAEESPQLHNIGFIIISQENDYHQKVVEEKKKNIFSQATALDMVNAKVYNSHEDFGSTVGHWTIFPLLEKIYSRLSADLEHAFSIDPKYEIANFIWNNGMGVKLQHCEKFCVTKEEPHCVSWIEEQIPTCIFDISVNNVFIAVKTCHKFHKSRVKVLKSTWAPEVENLQFFSDEDDHSIPTVKLNVENVPHGHCEKTLSIMKFYITLKTPLHWLIIVDDDTLINYQRLLKLLSCYDSSISVALGERYGYSVTNNLGYDYITGGGGMVFSLPAVKALVNNCYCPSIDSPDDMIIGMCLKKLNIPVTHSHLFHQARPTDYSSDLLTPFKHISFHKHWMIDPYDVYITWLKDNKTRYQHVELYVISSFENPNKIM